jgi:ADP-heptose:LPS heptosyltransferase
MIEKGQNYAIYDLNHSNSTSKCQHPSSKYLVTIPFGIGDAILYGLTAIDQIVRCFPASKGEIDVLCGANQAELFQYDPRINKVILVDVLQLYRKDTWKRMLFSSEQDELLCLVRDRQYEAIFPGNIYFSLFHHTHVMRPHLFDIVKDYLALRRLQDAPVTRRVRAIINNYFKTLGGTEHGEEGIPLYLNTELLIQGEQRVNDIKSCLSLPENGKLLLVAPDASHEITRPSTYLLSQGIKNALNDDPSLGVCILPSYTDRNASSNLEEQLALEYKEHIYSFPSEPQPSLLFLAAFIDHAEILITGDTSIMHLAAAKKTINESERSSVSPKNLTKIIALFGGTNPGFFGHSERTKIVGRGRREQKKVRPGIGKEGYDPKGRDFFDHISPGDVSQAILN